MENDSAGVAIVGAGLVGASVAWRLSQAGVGVRLFDAGVFGGEASSAGAGMLSPGGEFAEPSVWLDLGSESMRLYPAFVDELRNETGFPIDFRICGCRHLMTPEECSQACRRAEFQSSRGIRVELRSDSLFYHDDAFVDPAGLLRALRCACEARNVRIHERAPVAKIESSDYAAVVIAAGAWSGQIRASYRRRSVALPATIPVKGHLIGFQLDAGALGAMVRHGHTYVLQRSNGFTIAGSTEEQVGFDRTVDPAICEEIHRRASKLFPALERVAPSKCWIGFRPRSEGSGPHIGRLQGTNIWLAYGHYRNGILLTPITAQRVAGEIISSLA